MAVRAVGLGTKRRHIIGIAINNHNDHAKEDAGFHRTPAHALRRRDNLSRMGGSRNINVLRHDAQQIIPYCTADHKGILPGFSQRR